MKKILFAFVLSFIMLAQVQDAGAQSATPVTGAWDYTVETPQGETGGTLTLSDSSGVLDGTMAMADGQTLPLSDVILAGDTLSFKFTTQDHGSGTGEIAFTGETFEGLLTMLSYGGFPMRGTRQAAESTEVNSAALSTRTPLHELFQNEQARAVVEKHIPGLTTNPQIDQAMHMSLQDIAPYASETFTEQVLKAIDEDLARL